MALLQVGKTSQARALLTRPVKDEPGEILLHDGRNEELWTDRGYRLLRGEAERLILDAGFPADPFAPSEVLAVILIPQGQHVLTVIRYVERNPLCDGLVARGED
jgi:hypothetical protein